MQSDAYFEEAPGGTVHKPGVQNDVIGKIVTLYCEYAHGSSKEIDNDVVVTTGSVFLPDLIAQLCWPPGHVFRGADTEVTAQSIGMEVDPIICEMNRLRILAASIP